MKKLSNTIARLRVLLGQSGSMAGIPGKATGVMSLALSVLALLAVLAFHFPAHLSTPELRVRYDLDLLRRVLFSGMVLAAVLALHNLWLGRYRWLNGSSLFLLVLAAAAGGHQIDIGDFPDGTVYLGLDWLVLDLFFTAALFICIEKLWPLIKRQAVFRMQWQTDLVYFAVNHLLIGAVLLVTNALVQVSGAKPLPALAQTMAAWPIWVQVLWVVLLADLLQYAVHRLFHRVPFLWRFHRIHHSVEVMDWLAGSRLHVLEVIATRVPILIAFAWVGFSKQAVDVYVVIVGFQAVFNHANVRVHLGRLAWLRFIVVLPAFHHWHHGSDRAAIDKNFSAHFAWIDHLFGTAVQSPTELPVRYGLSGENIPAGFWAQQCSVFKNKMAHSSSQHHSDP